MSPGTQGALVMLITLVILLSGAPVAFSLGTLAIVFIALFQGFDALQVVAETFYAGLNDFTLVSIPMFVMMGAAIGSSPAGKDLYEALDRWLYRLPGGLVISNIGACALFAALTGSSPAISKMGIPESAGAAPPPPPRPARPAPAARSATRSRPRSPSSSTASPPRLRSGVCFWQA
jgi:TRAP-type mannitol/chloroaromatic compound transport system permease large subunit